MTMRDGRQFDAWALGKFAIHCPTATDEQVDNSANLDKADL